LDASSKQFNAVQKPPRRSGKAKAIAVIALVVIGVGAISWLRPARPRPVISIDLLGYTNRIGPHAFIAVTNRSDATITLHPSCMVEYAAKWQGPARSASQWPRVTSIEPHIFRVTELGPQKGFMQEFFVFPAGQKSDWQLVFSASCKSRWLEARRSAETWLHKHVWHAKWPLRSKTWEAYNSEWWVCPP